MSQGGVVDAIATALDHRMGKKILQAFTCAVIQVSGPGVRHTFFEKDIRPDVIAVKGNIRPAQAVGVTVCADVFFIDVLSGVDTQIDRFLPRIQCRAAPVFVAQGLKPGFAGSFEKLPGTEALIRIDFKSRPNAVGFRKNQLKILQGVKMIGVTAPYTENRRFGWEKSNSLFDIFCTFLGEHIQF